MPFPSPLNWSARQLNKLSDSAQLHLVEAYICLYVSIFVTTLAVFGYGHLVESGITVPEFFRLLLAHLPF